MTLHFSNARGRRRDASGPSPSLRICGLNGRCYLRGDEAHNTGPEPDLQPVAGGADDVDTLVQMHLCEHRGSRYRDFRRPGSSPAGEPAPSPLPALSTISHTLNPALQPQSPRPLRSRQTPARPSMPDGEKGSKRSRVSWTLMA